MPNPSMLELAAVLVAAQAKSTPLSTEALIASLRAIHHSLVALGQAELPLPNQGQAPLPRPPKLRTRITCLECGQWFRMLSSKHLKRHGLTPRNYKLRHGLPLSKGLSAPTLAAKRRRMAKQLGLGRELAAWREARNGTWMKGGAVQTKAN